jgi:hypothetical protein
MRYQLMIKATKTFEAGIWPDEKVLAEMAEWHEALVQAGAKPACERLQPSAQGARVRYANGQISITDGPFAETKELIAGFAIIQAESLAAAVEWAKRTPFQDGEIEIRPVMELDDIPVDSAEQPDGWREREEEFRAASPPSRKPGTQRYLGLVKADPDTEAGKMPDQQAMAAMGAFMEEGIKAGVFLGGEGLMPSSKGARVRFNGSKRTVTDGPFAETKELVAGYAILQFTSRAEAIEWTKRFVVVDAPCRYRGQCECEIRPIFELEQFGEKITEQFRNAGAR